MGDNPRTLRRPCQPTIRHSRIVLVYLEPVCARAIIRRGGLAVGCLGKPGGEGPRVEKAIGDVKSDVGASLDIFRGDVGSVSRRELVAGHLRGGHVGYGSVALVVLSFADVFPVSLFYTVLVDQFE